MNHDSPSDQSATRSAAPDPLTHEEYLARFRPRLAAVSSVHTYDAGRTVCNCAREDLSPGCLACKAGRWVCVFPAFACNASCTFCPRLTADNLERVMRRPQINLIERLIEIQRGVVTGVSISGGEIFFRHFETAVEIVARLRARFPELYLWAYTNGIAATTDAMLRLRDAGLDELRFNLAATNFDDDIVRRVEDVAVTLFPWVTVEVPSTRETREQLVSLNLLARLAAAGVRQLNLAEVRVPRPHVGSQSPATRQYVGRQQLYECPTGFGDHILSLVESRFCTCDVLDHAAENGLAIVINDCSQGAKTLQVLGRLVTGTHAIQAVANTPHENLLERQSEKSRVTDVFVRVLDTCPSAAVVLAHLAGRLRSYRQLGKDFLAARAMEDPSQLLSEGSGTGLTPGTGR